MRIEDAGFVVIDTETTGVNARSDRLIEVAAVRVKGGQITERFSQLIDPGRAIPSRITRITGISTGMVFGKPSAPEVLPWLTEFVGDDIFVAHNLNFDQRFIAAELSRCRQPDWNVQTLCTLRLARRLVRGLRSKGLASIADFYGIPIHGRHRALGDAEATANILLRFLETLKYEFRITDVEDVLSFQYRTYKQIGAGQSHLDRIRREILPGIPDLPGVYFMKNNSDAIVYIGKARRLSDRVRSYFNAVEAHPQRLRQLVEEVRDIGWKTTASELGALLLESRLIKKHQPRFNRAQRKYRARPFLRLDVNDTYPRLTVSAVAHHDGAEYFGPFANRREAEFLAKLVDEHFGLRECSNAELASGRVCALASLGRCLHTPCRIDARMNYAVEVNRVRAFLSGEDTSILEELKTMMRAASDELDFEKALEYREAIALLQSLLHQRQDLSRPVFQRNGVALWDRADGKKIAMIIGRGRLVKELELDENEGAWLKLRHAISEAAWSPPEERYWKEEADEVRLIQQWMYRCRDEVVAVDLDETPDPEAVVGQIRMLMTEKFRSRSLLSDNGPA